MHLIIRPDTSPGFHLSARPPHTSTNHSRHAHHHPQATVLRPSRGSLGWGFPPKNPVVPAASSLAIGCKLIHLRATGENCTAILLQCLWCCSAVAVPAVFRLSWVKSVWGCCLSDCEQKQTSRQQSFLCSLCVFFTLRTWLYMQSYGPSHW